MTTSTLAKVLRDSQSLCPMCLTLVPAQTVVKYDTVWMEKVCPDHGAFSLPISKDVSFTLAAMQTEVARFSWRQARSEAFGCPTDCGPCTAHHSPAGAVIIELTNDCNLPCKTCIAGSEAGGGAYLSKEQLQASIEHTIAVQGSIPILMLSGGEPTIHPDFFDLLRAATEYPEVSHVMVITNGKRLGDDPGFASRLSRDFPDVEIYLQFDSDDPAVLRELRGEDFSGLRERALDALEALNIPTSLVCVVNKRINLDEVGRIYGLAMSRRNIRGLTFQPIRSTGRHDSFDYDSDGTTLTDVRSALGIQLPRLPIELILPHPSCPESIALGYVSRKTGEPVTQEVVDAMRQEPVVPLFYQRDACDLFRVAIVCFYDRFNFCTDGIKQSIIQFAPPDGRLIPLDAYYLFYDSYTYIRPGSLQLPVVSAN